MAVGDCRCCAARPGGAIVHLGIDGCRRKQTVLDGCRCTCIYPADEAAVAVAIGTLEAAVKHTVAYCNVATTTHNTQEAAVGGIAIYAAGDGGRHATVLDNEATVGIHTGRQT